MQSEIGLWYHTFHRSVVGGDRIGIGCSSSNAERTALVAEHAGVATFVAARVDEFSLFALVKRHAAAGARLVAIASFFEQLSYGGQICKRKK